MSVTGKTTGDEPHYAGHSLSVVVVVVFSDDPAMIHIHECHTNHSTSSVQFWSLVCVLGAGGEREGGGVDTFHGDLGQTKHD